MGGEWEWWGEDLRVPPPPLEGHLRPSPNKPWAALGTRAALTQIRGSRKSGCGEKG